jgi:hypothetical protein
MYLFPVWSLYVVLVVLVVFLALPIGLWRSEADSTAPQRDFTAVDMAEVK